MLHRTCGVNGTFAEDFIKLPVDQQEALRQIWSKTGITNLNTITCNENLFGKTEWVFAFDLQEKLND